MCNDPVVEDSKRLVDEMKTLRRNISRLASQVEDLRYIQAADQSDSLLRDAIYAMVYLRLEVERLSGEEEEE